MTVSPHHRLRDALLSAGGTVSEGAPRSHALPPIRAPFASAVAVEHGALDAVDLGGAVAAPAGVGFLDGIQRYAVAGRLGVVPVVRGYASAAVLVREGQVLRASHFAAEEFVVAPLARLSAEHHAALGGAGLPIHDCETAERAHPILDVQLAAQTVERRREALELAVAARHLADAGDGWLVMDGSLPGLPGGDAASARVLGLIKSHETQFLEGPDLEVALTLPAGHRTSVFARGAGGRGEVYTWYLRLWPWEDHDLLFGLVRLERPPLAEVVAEATPISRWLLAERAPLAASDGRWDRLIYPIQHVEAYLRAQAGGGW